MSNRNLKKATILTKSCWRMIDFLMQCRTELHNVVHQDKKNRCGFCTEPLRPFLFTK